MFSLFKHSKTGATISAEDFEQRITRKHKKRFSELQDQEEPASHSVDYSGEWLDPVEADSDRYPISDQEDNSEDIISEVGSALGAIAGTEISPGSENISMDPPAAPVEFGGGSGGGSGAEGQF